MLTIDKLPAIACPFPADAIAFLMAENTEDNGGHNPPKMSI
ncbi:hypothetical protein [Nostoc sp. LEGE 06077]|nr:hypothetical protein [Nostoc sp. LEGE 06077]